MRVIAKSLLKRFWGLYPDSETPLRAWHAEAAAAVWKTPAEVKAKYGNASIVGDNRVVFNIHGNTYRLVVHINYGLGIVLTKWLGTHEQYNKIDATAAEPKDMEI